VGVGVIVFEYPLNERIRTMLRLEDLLEKIGHFQRSDGPREHHVALTTLFEVLEVAFRGDIKVDLIQELDRQRQSLLAFRNNPQISEEALSGALYEIEQASTALLAINGKVGQGLRDNEWLMSIKNRVGIPGGVCEFDLPSYHLWLNRPGAVRREHLAGWVKPFVPIREGLAIVLRLLRASGRSEPRVAAGGLFQMTPSGPAVQMIRIETAADECCVPEVSANRYALNIRFTTQDGGSRARPCERDVPFGMTLCNL
jgi:cell division protein ZapD